MLVTPPPSHILVTTPSSKCLKEAEADVVLEGRNSIRQHTKKGPEKDRQREKGTRERPSETKDTRDGKKKKKKKNREEEEDERKRNREEPRVRK